MLQTHLSRSICALAFCLAAFFATTAQAQFFGQQAVGGISINPDGVLSTPTVAEIRELKDYLAGRVKKTAPELAGKTELRMVSLRAVCDALKAAQGQKYEDLPPALMYLGGMQRLQYIFIYSEEKDIVLAGPGEGWKVDPNGTIVGETTNRPVLILHDLLIALQTTDAARQGGVSCSIDPSDEGRKNLDAFLSQQKVMHEGVPAGVEKALGRQVISLNGVPKTSHFARTLVAADYQMKRLAMKLEESPLPATLPSFLEMLTKGNARIDNMMPRWWMACNYEPLGRGADGLSWEIRGQGVKVLTEDEFIEAGAVKQTGKANPLAQKWADAMTKQYDKLSEKKPIFTEFETSWTSAWPRRSSARKTSPRRPAWT